MIELKELRDRKLIPKDVPVLCRCGEPLVSNTAMTSIECSDPICNQHGKFKLDKALKVLGISANIAEGTAFRMLEYFNLKHHMQIFMPDILNGVCDSSFASAFNKLKIEKMRLDVSGVFLYDFIDAFDLPTLGMTRSKLIFINFTTVEDFFDKFGEDEEQKKAEMREYIAIQIKMAPYTDTVYKIVDELIENEMLIRVIGQYFKFRPTYNETLFVAQTGPMKFVTNPDGSPFKPREKACEYWSDKYGVNIVSTGLSKKHVQYLIMDNEAMKANAKYEKATAVGITVLTSREFDDMLRERKETIEGAKSGSFGANFNEEEVEEISEELKDNDTSLGWN